MSLSNVRKCCQSKSKITQQYNQHQQTQRNTINRQLAPAMGTETRLYSLPLPRAQKPGYNKTLLLKILCLAVSVRNGVLSTPSRGSEASSRLPMVTMLKHICPLQLITPDQKFSSQQQCSCSGAKRESK
jgi:hypothetical protein